MRFGSVGEPLYQSKYSVSARPSPCVTRALHLAFGRGGMDDGAAIDRGRRFPARVTLPVARIDLDFRRLRREVVGARLVAVAAVVGKLGRIVEIADADDRLAVGLIDVRAHDRGDRPEIGFAAAARADLAVDDRQLFRRAA